MCTIYVRTDHFNCEYHRPLVITQPRSGEEQKQNQQPATNKDYIVQIHINTTKTDSRRAQRRRSPWHHHPHLIPSHLGHCQPTSQQAISPGNIQRRTDGPGAHWTYLVIKLGKESGNKIKIYTCSVRFGATATNTTTAAAAAARPVGSPEITTN